MEKSLRHNFEFHNLKNNHLIFDVKLQVDRYIHNLASHARRKRSNLLDSAEIALDLWGFWDYIILAFSLKTI